MLTSVLLAVSIAALAAGAILHVASRAEAASGVWSAVALAGLAAAGWWVVASLRHRLFGVDVIAVIALAGTLVVGEPLAGAVITIMLLTGRALEAHASARAGRELAALLSRVPRTARRRDGHGGLELVPVGELRPGDVLFVGRGEVVAVDGRVERGVAVLDESSLTGEAIPVERTAGSSVRSGVVNAGDAFELRATTTASESTYGGIVRLVQEARADTAPFVRLADRQAGLFVGLSLLVAALAWAVSGDFVRAIAVLVVATPCPLVLAAPVAIVSGLSRAAERGVLVKDGGALERLAAGRVLLLDKTGTLTVGVPTLTAVVPAARWSEAEILRLAASLDQVSPHVLAEAMVRAARSRGLALDVPVDVQEVAGQGERGLVAGHEVAIGRAEWVDGEFDASWSARLQRRADSEGALAVFVSVDGGPAGAVLLADPVRPDAARTIRALRQGGIERIVLITGDRADVAESVGAVIGVDAVLAERTPAEKADAVRLERQQGPTIMVGDGINDAPALALADVGVAMGARGGTASTEVADVVLTVERIDRLGDAVAIARRAGRIARQSVAIGMGLSLAAMALAAVGLIPLVMGAFLQEAIDAAAILNALRALHTRSIGIRLPPEGVVLTRRFGSEHHHLRPILEEVRHTADRLGTDDPKTGLDAVLALEKRLVEDLLPHEEAEDAELYPVLGLALGGVDPTAPMSRAHLEIRHQVRRLGRLLRTVDATDPNSDDLLEIRRLLYGLHAVLLLHFSQEEEAYLSLGDLSDELVPAPASPRSAGGGGTRGGPTS